MSKTSDLKDTIKSIFKRLVVYNTDKQAVNIEKIQLTNPAYTALVNGKKGQFFENIRLFGNDSLKVLVSANINPSNASPPFLVSDQLAFSTNNNTQNIKIVSWGQNAHFLDRRVITTNTTWTNDRPYVLSDTIFVGPAVTLTIDPGTRVYLDHLAGIFTDGNMMVNGTHNQRVLFRNLRTGRGFDNLPGQWIGLLFGNKSHGNLIEYADIRNAVNGIHFGAPDEDNIADLILNNCKIKNMAGSLTTPFISGYGVLAFTSDIKMNNTLINSCATSSVGLLARGNYTLNHCTLANFSFATAGNNPAATLTNSVTFGNGKTISTDFRATITNSIIWGDLKNEFVMNRMEGVGFNVDFQNNLIRSSDQSLSINGNILGEDPLFVSPETYNYHLEELSPAISEASPSSITSDLDNIDRGDLPDIGAYEWVGE